jgi:hypothetical protein
MGGSAIGGRGSNFVPCQSLRTAMPSQLTTTPHSMPLRYRIFSI